MNFDYVLTAEAETDLDEILIQSYLRFRRKVRESYEELILAAFEDIAADPKRVGVKERPELGATTQSWHLASSKSHVPDSIRKIEEPRHLVIFRVESHEVIILRLLHESMDIPSHLIPGATPRSSSAQLTQT